MKTNKFTIRMFFPFSYYRYKKDLDFNGFLFLLDVYILGEISVFLVGLILKFI